MADLELSPEALAAAFHSLSSEADLNMQRGLYHEAVAMYTSSPTV